MLQSLVCQSPTNGAVAQGSHGIGQARVDQGLRADNAPRAASAVDDHACRRIGRQFAHTQDQFGSRHGSRRRNAHGVKLVEAPHVKNHNVGFGIDQALHLMGGK